MGHVSVLDAKLLKVIYEFSSASFSILESRKNDLACLRVPLVVMRAK